MKTLLKCFGSLCNSSKAAEDSENRIKKLHTIDSLNKESVCSPREGSRKEMQQRKLLT